MRPLRSVHTTRRMHVLAVCYCAATSCGLLLLSAELLGVRAADSDYLFTRTMSEWYATSSDVLPQLKGRHDRAYLDPW